MAFTITYTRGDSNGRDTYDDAHTYEVKEWGVIEVTKDGEQVKLYSPNFWTAVVPGQPSSGGRVTVL